MLFIRFLIRSSGGPRVQRSKTIYAILVEGITGLSHPFLGMGPGPMELGKLAAF